MAKAPTDIRSLARTHTAMAMRVLAQIAEQPKAPPAARVAAAQALLDRGWGKAPISMTVETVEKRVVEEPLTAEQWSETFGLGETAH